MFLTPSCKSQRPRLFHSPTTFERGSQECSIWRSLCSYQGDQYSCGIGTEAREEWISDLFSQSQRGYRVCTLQSSLKINMLREQIAQLGEEKLKSQRRENGYTVKDGTGTRMSGEWTRSGLDLFAAPLTQMSVEDISQSNATHPWLVQNETQFSAGDRAEFYDPFGFSPLYPHYSSTILHF